MDSGRGSCCCMIRIKFWVKKTFAKKVLAFYRFAGKLPKQKKTFSVSLLKLNSGMNAKKPKRVFFGKNVFAKTCDEEKEWSCLKNNVIKRVDDINFLSQYFYVFGAPF